MTAISGVFDGLPVRGHDGYSWTSSAWKPIREWDVKSFFVLASVVAASFVGVSYQRGWNVDLTGGSEVESWLALEQARPPEGPAPASSNLLVALADDDSEADDDFAPPAPPVIPAKPPEAKPASPPTVKSAADSLLGDLELPSIDEMSPPIPPKKIAEPPPNPSLPPAQTEIAEDGVVPPAPPSMKKAPPIESPSTKPVPSLSDIDPLDPLGPSTDTREIKPALPPGPASQPAMAPQPPSIPSSPLPTTNTDLPRVVSQEKTPNVAASAPKVAREEGYPEEGNDVIARSQPLTREERVTPASVVGIDRGAPIASSAAPEATTAEPPSDVKNVGQDPSYTLLQDSPRGYIPLAPSSASQRQIATLKPLAEGEIARMGSRVVDKSYFTRVYKTDANRNMPEVTSYDVTIVRPAEGDTFESIARANYRSSSFGEALARYNNSRQSPSEPLSPRSQVRIPPRDILESQFGYPEVSAKEGFKRVNEPILGLEGSRDETAESSKMRQRVASSSADRVDTTASPFDDRIARSLSTPTTTNSEYRVDQEETLWSIAKKRLGDGRRWKEIYQLNRDKLTSDVHVPVGVTLKLPTE